MNKSEIKVSVLCATYNHEKYIAQCLESLVGQETNFDYEIIVHDDASTDNTRKIVEEYANKYPDKIKPIFQEVNQYSQNIRIFEKIITPMAKGKYFAYCEGDDYWCDNKKLQKQFDILESKEECTMCVTNTIYVNEAGAFSKELKYVDCDEEWDLKKFCGSKYDCFNTCNFFIRADVIANHYFTIKDCTVGDVPIILSALLRGNIYILKDFTSCYRRCSISSWSSKVGEDKNRYITVFQMFLKLYKALDEATQYKFSDDIMEKIFFYEFQIGYTNGEKQIFKNPNYLSLFKKMSLKEKMIARMKIYFPNIFGFLIRTRQKIKLKK